MERLGWLGNDGLLIERCRLLGNYESTNTPLNHNRIILHKEFEYEIDNLNAKNKNIEEANSLKP